MPGSQTWIVRRRPDGTTAWTQGLTYVRRQMFSSLLEAENGDLLAAGLDVAGGAVARFRQDGTLAWCHTLDLRITHYSAAVAELANGDVLYAMTGVVARFSPSGDLLGTWTFTAPEPIQWLAGLAPTSDGGALVAASYSDARNQDSLRQSVVLRLTPAMELAWARRLAGVAYLHAIGTARDPAGGMLISGRGDFLPDRRGDGFIASVTEVGDLAWATAVDSGAAYDGVPHPSVWLVGTVTDLDSARRILQGDSATAAVRPHETDTVAGRWLERPAGLNDVRIPADRRRHGGSLGCNEAVAAPIAGMDRRMCSACSSKAEKTEPGRRAT